MTKSKRSLYIPYSGPSLLETPLLNKGSAFNEQERINFNLVGSFYNSFIAINQL
mgnify:CR=1 FL=1